MRALLPLLLLGSILPAPKVAAQDLSIAGSIVHARYAGSVSGTATGASARFRSPGPRSNLTIATGLSSFTTGELAFNAAANAVKLLTESDRGVLGLTGAASYGSVEGTPWTGTASGGLVGAAPWGTAFVSLAVTAGGARDIYGASFGLVTAGLGVSRPSGRDIIITAGVGGTAVDTLEYVDFTAGVTYQPAGWELVLNLGTRTGDLAEDSWASAFVATRISPGLSLEIGTGWYPEDYKGFTEGYFFSAALRLHPVSTLRPLPRATPLPATVQVHRTDSASVSIVIARQGDSVALAGEFNGWTPEPMSQLAPGLWEVELNLSPGIYEFALVVDGEWVVPEGVPSVDDGMGGRTGLLTIR